MSALLNRYLRDLKGGQALMLIVVCAALCLLPGIAELPLIDRDEPRFARATIEMMERGDWVVPYFNNEYRFDKPPLTYWWMGASIALLGESEMAARMHSWVSTVLTAIVLFFFARRLTQSVAVATGAALVWLGCFQVFIHARMAVADMPLVLSIALSMLALWEIQASRIPLRVFWKSAWFHLLWVSIGMGFLAKGPLAILVPMAAMLIAMGWARLLKYPVKAYGMLAMWVLAASLPALCLVGAWALPAFFCNRWSLLEGRAR